MPRRRSMGYLILLCSIFVCGIARPSDRHKSGIAVESFGAHGQITNGLMAGFRSLHYFDMAPHLNYGWELAMGNARGAGLDRDNLAYGGLSLNYDAYLANKLFFYEVSLFAGYGFGREDALGYSGHSVVVKPEISLGLTMIEGYRASFGVGWFMMPSVSGFNAPSFTVRFDHQSSEAGEN